MKKWITVCLVGVLSMLSVFNVTALGNEKTLYGNLEVDIHFTMPLKNQEDNHLTLVVENSDHSKLELPLTLKTAESITNHAFNNLSIKTKIRKLNYAGLELAENDEILSYYAVTLYNLPQGTYKITLKGDGYKTTALDGIKLDTYSKRVEISSLRGNFEAGDINQDGLVNQTDLDLLISHFGSDSPIYDLNRDGVADLIDITYLATVLNNKEISPSIKDTNAIIDANQVEINGNISSGEKEDLFDNDLTKVVSVKPTNDSVISSNNPATLEITFDDSFSAEKLKLGANQNSDINRPTSMNIVITDIYGTTYNYTYEFHDDTSLHPFSDDDGSSIVIDLGKQVAVKKVIINVTGTKNNTNLVEIATVEFLNNVYKEVPRPTITPPLNVSVVPGSEQVTVNWSYMSNVTGYEVLVERRDENNVYESHVYQTSYNTYTVKELKNYTEYTISVQSTSGEWKSGYSSSVKVTPIPNRLPPSVEGVTITGKFLGLHINWKAMKDTKSYNLFYRMKGEEKYQVIRNINSNQYDLNNLEDTKEYEVYLTGNNELGEGSASKVYLGTTSGLTPPVITNYGLINTSNGKGILTSHITDVQFNNYDLSLYPEGFNPFNIVDDDYVSHWTAPSSAWYNNGPTITFDDAYLMDHFIFVTRLDGDYRNMYAAYSLSVMDEDGVWHVITNYNDNIYPTSIENGVYQISFEKQRVKGIRLGLTRAYGARLSLSEMKFYFYDSLEDEVDGLFEDDLHITLKSSVTLEQINSLIERANTVDSVSGEYHPKKNLILEQLELAKSILSNTYLSDVIIVKQTLTNAKNSHLGFAMSLNDYQSLGIVAKAGEEIEVYIGTEGNILPQIVFTQFYPESSQWTQTVTNLKKGRNTIRVPKIGNMDTERGGSVYLRYPSSKETSEIKVRVSGGVKIPVLDLYGMNNEALKKEAIRNYIQELEKYVNALPSVYQDQKTTDEFGNKLGNVYAYDEKTNVLNSTEIGTQNVLLSISATKAWQGIKGSSLEEEVDRLYNSLLAFEQMMKIMYQQKGLYLNPDIDEDGIISDAEAKHAYPSSRIGIRYTRMFDGAFMYATGGHIGIESGSIPGLMNGRPIEVNEQSEVTTSGFFGWGISHEIGHVIDEGNMIYGETSNNIYSLFIQTADDKQLSRLETSNIYPEIYKKVTSGTTGISSNVFVSLGMFWQLHLAYDNNKTLDDVNSFYAELNRLYRTTSLKADKDNLLIMLASEVVGKDLTDFFRKWGLVPSEETLNYLKEKGYEKETRAIYYLNDAARRYRLNNGLMFGTGILVDVTLKYDEGYGFDSKKVTLNFQVSDQMDRVLGYEILRNGVPIAFVNGDTNTYVDVVSSINNQTLTYEVVAYDYYLNKTEVKTLDSIKITHDGSVAKDNFLITGNMKNDQDVNEEGSSSDVKLSINNLIDGKEDTYFLGNMRTSSTDKTSPYVIIDLNSKMPLVGIKYRAMVQNSALLEGTIKKYEIYVSTDKENWILAKKGSFNVSLDNPVQTVYFDKEGTTGGNQAWTYNISYIKIVSVGASSISGAEIDFITPPGDNIELNQDGIGVLKEDFVYGIDQDDVIKKGSIIFTGSYRGNPAFNELLLIDEYGNTVNGTAIFMAEQPDGTDIMEISEGTWIFVVDEDTFVSLGDKIKVNLYRVDDAISSTGQRFVSNTLYVALPEVLPEITLSNGKESNI